MTETDLIVERRARAGRITLNRPAALNALTHSMVLEMTEALLAWRSDPAVELVVVDGAGERAFCAGADIKALYALCRCGRREEAAQFFRDEYRLNHLIRSFGKPYVALIDGVTMGGGVGLSVHGSHRVATERTLWAMPETAIGLFPDVGMTYVLPHLPDHMGMWLGLSGARLDGPATCALGLSTHYADAAGVTALTEALEQDGIAALKELAPAPDDNLQAIRSGIAAAFAQTSVINILDTLDAGSEAMREQAGALRTMSPTSLALTFEALSKGADLPFANALRKEMRMAVRCLEGHDFIEGVRAQLIDKDRQPKWRPASLESVSKRDIEAFFQPLAPGDEVQFAV